MQLKPYKKDFEHSYSFGVFPTLELLEHRADHVTTVLISSKGSKNEGVLKITEICERGRIRIEANDRLVERVSPRENVYAIGVFQKYRERLRKGRDQVVLVNPADMGNLGTIMRTMLGFGMLDLALVRPAADAFDPRTIRASMGAIFQVSFQYFDTFNDYREAFNPNLYPFMTNGKQVLGNLAFARPFSLVFGNESAGLPEEYREMGTSVTIRHRPAIDSLNLPVAVAIALYEATRNDFGHMTGSEH
jgi:RNA methyltransferase, TrmH family